jgi:arginine N-succinyltransferase
MAEPPYFRAVMTTIRDEGSRGIAVENDAWEHLQLHHSSPLIVLPID